MRVDFLASRPHYLDHLAPIARALGDDLGSVIVAEGLDDLARWHGLTPVRDAEPGDVLVVAGFRDTRTPLHGRRLVLVEHGVGQTYGESLPEYPGGRGRDRVSLFLAPNRSVFDANAAAYPAAAHALIGSPRMDEWHGRPTPPELVAVTRHWHTDRIPEMGSAWPHHRLAVADLAGRRPLLGHAHPRAAVEMRRWCADRGVPFASHLSTVFAAASLLIADNTSAMFEFAALGRPVVVLNAPWFRRSVEHGLRFWRLADVGVQVDESAELAAAVELALTDPPEVAERRVEVVAELFPLLDGRASQRAADAIRSV